MSFEVYLHVFIAYMYDTVCTHVHTYMYVRIYVLYARIHVCMYVFTICDEG